MRSDRFVVYVKQIYIVREKLSLLYQLLKRLLIIILSGNSAKQLSGGALVVGVNCQGQIRFRQLYWCLAFFRAITQAEAQNHQLERSFLFTADCRILKLGRKMRLQMWSFLD